MAALKWVFGTDEKLRQGQTPEATAHLAASIDKMGEEAEKLQTVLGARPGTFAEAVQRIAGDL